MNYKITTGHDYYNNVPLYHVTGTDNDYVGEWHTDRSDAETELEQLETRARKRQ